MTDTPYLGELRLMSFNFAPSGWAQCNGQLLPLTPPNQPLFFLLGVMYGGDGKTNFALPDLRGRAPFHRGKSLTQGKSVGAEVHILKNEEMPKHNHQLMASSTNADRPVPSVLGAANNLYRPSSDLTSLHPATLTTIGGGQPHENRQPALTLEWCIALSGIVPSPN